ncbi:MAG: Fic family protein [Proteobacteria bacterium]|nr:Fic family protein [Pseudomonadota bacterium]
MQYDNLTAKKKLLDGYMPLPAALIQNLDEWFRVELTYTSNALEGNTLTRRETAVVLEKNITIGGKSLVEHLEVINHGHALDFTKTLARKKLSELGVEDILAIHQKILKGINDDDAGRYRTVAVRIAGAHVVMPNHAKVPELMRDFMQWLHNAHDLHPVALAGQAHHHLVSIHPFIDGNGRTARLLMNLLLLMHGYPPAIIRKRDRLAYISALEKGQLGGSRANYDALIAKAVSRSFDIYLDALKG